MINMTMAPINCGTNAKNASRPARRDSIIYLLSLRSVGSKLSRFLPLRSAGAGPRSPQAANGPTDEREEQGEYARNAQDGPKPLLRGGLLGALLSSLGQRDARELVYEAYPQKAAYDRQHQRHRQRQERHQEPVLEAGAGRHPSSGVAAYQEGQKQRDQEPYEGGYAAFSQTLASGGAEDGADYSTYNPAQDEAGPKGGEPPEHHAHPASAPLFFSWCVPRASSGAHLTLVHPLGVGIALPFRHCRSPLSVVLSERSLAYLCYAGPWVWAMVRS